jgi:hypothetical protein
MYEGRSQVRNTGSNRDNIQPFHGILAAIILSVGMVSALVGTIVKRMFGLGAAILTIVVLLLIVAIVGWCLAVARRTS